MKIPEFAQRPLHPPAEWLERWINEAEEAGEIEPTAMSLSTISTNGAPRVRFVLCKGVSEDGILFFTNLDSPKANEISSDPRASVAFHWPTLNRQVRIEGRLQKTSDQEADSYFQTRGRLSKIGAWASKQSQPLESRETLLKAVDDYSSRFNNGVPRPNHWSGFRLQPSAWEFWQGEEARLHDRWTIHKLDGNWISWRLYP